MFLRRLAVVDFRNYERADIELAEGLTAVLGDNGQGKSNLLEAIAFAATLDSFRGAPSEALVRAGCERAAVHAEVVRGARLMEVDVEVGGGRTRAQVNRQRLARARDLLGALRVTVFSPDDLVLLKGGPAERRRFLDDLLVAERPGRDALRAQLERTLRQRNALLRQLAGTRPEALSDADGATLDVWDDRLAEAGTAWAAEREGLVRRLEPFVAKAYADLAPGAGDVVLRHDSPWLADGLAVALARSRPDDLRRGATGVGPHRDDLVVTLDGLVARTHASQGEQRSLAFALRIGGHRLVEETAGSPPVLLLDDVFSELDPDRSRLLLDHLPAAQTVLTTAGPLPAGARADRVLRVRGGVIAP